MGVDTHMLLPRAVAMRLWPPRIHVWIDERGSLQREPAWDPPLVDGEVLPVLDRWGAVMGDPEAAAYRLGGEVGDSVVAAPGDPRGIYLFPDSVTAQGTTYAEALAWLEARGEGRWVAPRIEDHGPRDRLRGRAPSHRGRGRPR
jgi:hypothetical protein